MPNRNLFRPLLALFAWLALTLALDAQDPALAARMRDRLPAVDNLLQAGLVGENNQGFLTERGALSDPQRQTLREENRDRAAVYEAISRKTGQPPNLIGQSRAEQIRQRAVSGIWLQAADGKWYRK